MNDQLRIRQFPEPLFQLPDWLNHPHVLDYTRVRNSDATEYMDEMLSLAHSYGYSTANVVDILSEFATNTLTD